MLGAISDSPRGSRAPCRPRTRLRCSHPRCCGRSYTCTFFKSFLSQLSVPTQDLGTHCSPSCLLSLSKFSSSVASSTTGASSAFLPPAPVQPDYQLQEGRDITKPTAKQGSWPRAWGKKPNVRRQGPCFGGTVSKTTNQQDRFRWRERHKGNEAA